MTALRNLHQKGALKFQTLSRALYFLILSLKTYSFFSAPIILQIVTISVSASKVTVIIINCVVAFTIN